MRLGNFDCGCDNRKEIMFTYGNLGITEAAIVATFAAVLFAAIYYQRTK